jgi:ribonuclease BN (tRNA processing enzyme)
MVYDANYTEDDYGPHEGWGHSTWQAAVRVAERAGARTLVLFHHDPARTDAMLDAIAAEAGRARPGTLVAREGLTLVA